MMILLFSLNSICQNIQKDSISFSKEEVNKIANIMFDMDNYKSEIDFLYKENSLLSTDRDNAYKGLKDANKVIDLNNNVINNYSTSLKVCDSTNIDLINKNEKLKNNNSKLGIIAICEGGIIILLTLLLF